MFMRFHHNLQEEKKEEKRKKREKLKSEKNKEFYIKHIRAVLDCGINKTDRIEIYNIDRE